MRKVVVINHLTLDGVMQAPGRPDEDPRGGFQHGGWAQSGSDSVMGEELGTRMGKGGDLLLGRWTYEMFADYWPKQGDNNSFTTPLNNAQKYVASTTLEEPLPWVNSTLLKGDAIETVARLKKELGKDLTIFGSGQLIRSLMQHNLIDEFLLMIHPLVLGTGQRLFNDNVPLFKLNLVDSVTTTTGVMIATYQPSY